MKTFYTSDTHFGHDNIRKYCKRPYSTVEQMDSSLINNWNSVVSKEDTVYHLGDFSFGRRNNSRDIDRARDILVSLNGHKKLVLGNHDGIIPALREEFDWIGNYLKIEDEGAEVVLFHYPITEWDGFFRGSTHLFGHVHANRTVLGRAWDVGVDNNDYTPVTMKRIMDNLALKIEEEESSEMYK